MRSFLAILLALATTIPARPADLRVAVVRVADIYKTLDSTKTTQANIEAERAAVNRDPRVERMNQLRSELETIQAQLNDRANPLDNTVKQQLARTYELKRGEFMALQKEFEALRAERNKQISGKMVKAMRRSLDLIATTAAKLGKEQGYDCVWEISGETNTGEPLLLYCKPANDLTDEVLLALGGKPAAKPVGPTAANPEPVPAPAAQTAGAMDSKH